MRFQNKHIQKFWRFSTSFALGIPIMVALTILIAWGTIVESQYDAWTAGQVVYRSWMMYVTMGLLVYNLALVIVDRWPWKWNHYPFILVHVGIIFLIVGGYITQKWGIDGTMPIPLGGKSRLVTVHETDFVVYATFDGDRYSKIHDYEVHFYKNPPSPLNPVHFSLSGGDLKILDYVPYAKVNQKVVKTEEAQFGSSVRFQLSNANVTQLETLTQASAQKSVDVSLGLLKVHLGHDVKTKGRKDLMVNEIYLTKLTSEKIQYQLFDKNSDRPYKTGEAQIGSDVDTHWMGLKLKILDYLPLAKTEWDIQRKERPTPLTTAAIQIEYKDKKHWMVLNDVLKIFSEDSAFLLSYQNRRIELDFDVKLDKFEIVNYQGTQKAMQYSSAVQVLDKNQTELYRTTIAMNEPMKYQGYTFYQASFQNDERTGQPVASILSVNQDPGRQMKYLGSLIFSLGVVWLFYQKRKRKTAV